MTIWIFLKERISFNKSSVWCWQCSQSGLKYISNKGWLFFNSAFVNMVVLSIWSSSKGGIVGNFKYAGVMESAWLKAARVKNRLTTNNDFFKILNFAENSNKSTNLQFLEAKLSMA